MKASLTRSWKEKIVEKVELLKYLVSTVTWNGSCTEEIRSRISIGKTTFEKVKALLKTRRIPIEMKKRIPKCFIWNVIYMAVTHVLSKRKKNWT